MFKNPECQKAWDEMMEQFDKIDEAIAEIVCSRDNIIEIAVKLKKLKGE